jgi:hypothetical protein
MNHNKTDFGAILVSGFSYTAGIENQPIHQSTYISNPVKGDGLTHRSSGQHTIQIHTINANCCISIDATLDQDPCSNAWLPIPLTNTASGNISTVLNYVFTPPVPGVPYSGKTIELNQFFMAIGQYAWLRANISCMSNGIVDSIKVAF